MLDLVEYFNLGSVFIILVVDTPGVTLIHVVHCVRKNVVQAGHFGHVFTAIKPADAFIMLAVQS